MKQWQITCCMNAANDNNIIYVHKVHISLSLSNSSKLTFLTVTLLHLEPDPQTCSRVPCLTLGQILKHIHTHTHIVQYKSNRHTKPSAYFTLFYVSVDKTNAAFKRKYLISGFPVWSDSVEIIIRWGGKTKQILIAYFLSNISVKIIKICSCMSKLYKVTVDQFFSAHRVYFTSDGRFWNFKIRFDSIFKKKSRFRITSDFYSLHQRRTSD